jgi:hypothetical protein
MTHSLIVSPQPNALGVAVVCRGCSNPEPIDCEYVWMDRNGDVLFCGGNPLDLFEFMLRHDMFKITQPGRPFRDARENANPTIESEENHEPDSDRRGT